MKTICKFKNHEIENLSLIYGGSGNSDDDGETIDKGKIKIPGQNQD